MNSSCTTETSRRMTRSAGPILHSLHLLFEPRFLCRWRRRDAILRKCRIESTSRARRVSVSVSTHTAVYTFGACCESSALASMEHGASLSIRPSFSVSFIESFLAMVASACLTAAFSRDRLIFMSVSPDEHFADSPAHLLLAISVTLLSMTRLLFMDEASESPPF
uniref:Uncharacterized protein n=1 Tax=Zea mays TaxID=4577 RepID=B6T251_MAIZE|nr:hypothetical protein [Zea mays]